MRIKSLFAMVAALAIGTSAQAAFTFTVPTITSAATFTSADGLVVVTPNVRTGPTSGVFDTRSTAAGVDVNFADPTVTTTIPAGTSLAETIPFSYVVTIRDAVNTLTGNVTVSGTIAGNVSGTGSILRITSYAIAPTTLNLGGDIFTIGTSVQGPGTAPNIGTGPGAFVINVNSVVPEPASIALLGLGGLGALGLLRRRRAAQA